MTERPAPRTLSDAERLDWLRLSRSENVGPITFRELVRRFGSAGAALEALPGLARRGGRIGSIRIASRPEAAREAEALARLGAHLIALVEPDYPPLLAQIADPPPLIALRGAAHLFERPSLAIVGARNASAAGIRFTERLAADLGREGYAIVSGLARGIDAAAHRASLATGTLAVVAGGLDIAYPAENSDLMERIAAEGALIAESPLGTQPTNRHFPRRNRIVSGLAQGVLVVEAASRSGSLITARLALEQGRDVFAVPGSPLDPRCHGTNNLIREGATLTERASDVLDVLRSGFAQYTKEPLALAFDGAPGEGIDERTLEPARKEILNLLGPTPITVDELIRLSQLTPAMVATILLELELAGRLNRQPGSQVSLIEIGDS